MKHSRILLKNNNMMQDELDVVPTTSFRRGKKPIHMNKPFGNPLDYSMRPKGNTVTIEQLYYANEEMAINNKEKEKLSFDLLSANKELAVQNKEIQKRAEELDIANKELMFQNKEKEKRAAELSLANIELAYQNNEKENRAAELIVANKELLFQNMEKEKRAKELVVANHELTFQNNEKEKRAAELAIANIELAYENNEKEKRAAELIVANKELAYQNSEKENRAKELVIANKELAVANHELMFQNKEKEKRAAELAIANIELAYENIEKEKRAAELIVANKELAYQNSEKENRAKELVIANQELAFWNVEKEKRVIESIFMSNHDHLTGLNNRRSYEEELMKIDQVENLPITIVMGDINGLKMINDSFGHCAGDTLLKVVAEILKKTIRPNDLVARIGGDEFVLVLPKTSSADADQIIGLIKKMLLNDPSNQLQISVSFGLETKTSIKEDIQELFQRAENQMYRQKLSETGSMRSQTIDLIMRTLFAKNPREAKHSERVGFICEKIAMFLELGESVIHDMRIAGMMHDIGKIGISESILNKPGRLTEDEWSQMKKHPEISYRILSTTQEFSTIADFILQHHERWNGCGYPNGLKAEEIMKQARIIAIADSYDAMTSDRTYQAKMTDEEALIEIQKCSGTLYDPEIVRVFGERHAELYA